MSKFRPEDHIFVAFDLFDSEQIPLDEALSRAVGELRKAKSRGEYSRLKQVIKNQWSNVSNQPFPEDAFDYSKIPDYMSTADMKKYEKENKGGMRGGAQGGARRAKR